MYYKYNVSVKKKSKKSVLVLIVSIILLLGGAYLLFLTQSPAIVNNRFHIASSIDLNTEDDAHDNRNRIQIEKLNIEVPYYGEGPGENTPASLEKGAWWRFSDRGNPIKGGNFILSAHRFSLGLTPGGTRVKSPFYNIDKLSEGDNIRVHYEGKWYDYKVKNSYSVARDAVKIEDLSTDPKLTLYSCSLKGEADGRLVIVASPQFVTPNQKPSVHEFPFP
jgi:sortase A